VLIVIWLALRTSAVFRWKVELPDSAGFLSLLARCMMFYAVLFPCCLKIHLAPRGESTSSKLHNWMSDVPGAPLVRLMLRFVDVDLGDGCDLPTIRESTLRIPLAQVVRCAGI
jgi:hypothetical protein